MDTPSRRLPQVLLVEDHHHDAHYLQMAFTPYLKHLDFLSVSNAEEALEVEIRHGRVARSQLPDLVVLDLEGQETCGQVLQAVMQDERLRMVPTIVLSHSHRRQDIESAYRLGALLYLVKPTHFQRWRDLAAAFANLVGVHLGGHVLRQASLAS